MESGPKREDGLNTFALLSEGACETANSDALKSRPHRNKSLLTFNLYRKAGWKE